MCNEEWWFRGTLQFYCTVIRLCIDKITLFIIPFNPNKITDLQLFVPINFKLPLYEAYQFALSINEEAATSTILLLWEFVYLFIFLSFDLCSWSKWVDYKRREREKMRENEIERGRSLITVKQSVDNKREQFVLTSAGESTKLSQDITDGVKFKFFLYWYLPICDYLSIGIAEYQYTSSKNLRP